MDILQVVAKQAVMIAVFMAVGFSANKLHILDQEANNRITNLLVKVVSPIMIFVSYQRDYDAQLLKNLGLAVMLAAAAFVLSVALGFLLLPGRDPDHGAIERFAAVYPNLGFMGIPLVNAVLGSEGVFYATASMTVFDLFCWTHGVLLMSGSCSFRELLRKLLSPSIVSVVVSLTCFLLRLRLPDILLSPLESISAVNTPLAMMVIGSTIAQTSLLRAFAKPKLYYVSLCRLLLIPAATLLLFRFLPGSTLVRTAILLVMSCPSATYSVVFSILFEKDYRYASEIVAFSTLFSMATLPLIVWACTSFLA